MARANRSCQICLIGPQGSGWQNFFLSCIKHPVSLLGVTEPHRKLPLRVPRQSETIWRMESHHTQIFLANHRLHVVLATTTPMHSPTASSEATNLSLLWPLRSCNAMREFEEGSRSWLPTCLRGHRFAFARCICPTCSSRSCSTRPNRLRSTARVLCSTAVTGRGE
jgi:hypothetical protein